MGIPFCIMATYRVLTYKRCPSKENWLLWHNKYHFQYDTPLTKQGMEQCVDNVFAMEYYFHLDTTQFYGALIYEVEAAMQGGIFTASNFVIWRNASAFGARHATQIPKYRYILQTGQSCWPFNDRRLSFHGSITEDDLFFDPQGKLTLISALYFQEMIRGTYEAGYDAFWHRWVAPIAPDPQGNALAFTPVTGMFGAFGVDAHAATRCRQQAAPRGVLAFNNYLEMITALSAAAATVRSEVEVQTDFVFPIYWEIAVSALSGMKTIGQKITKYLTDATDGSDTPTEPVSRFGLTGANIMKALDKAGSWVDQALPPLENAYHPVPGPGGDPYISPDHLRPYADALDEWTAKLSSGLDFDWFNPNAYPRTGNDKLPPRMPDIIALQL